MTFLPLSGTRSSRGDGQIRIKVYQRGDQTVVAACDAELIGQTFEEGEMVLKVTSFYDDFSASEEELLVDLKAVARANLVGKKVVNVAIPPDSSVLQ